MSHIWSYRQLPKSVLLVKRQENEFSSYFYVCNIHCICNLQIINVSIRLQSNKSHLKHANQFNVLHMY